MFSPLRSVFAAIVVLLSACGFQAEVAKRVYLEARMKDSPSGIEVVFLAATASQSECQPHPHLLERWKI
jgi:hypothetical protein